ncbi:hypothetical protein E2C01_075998 [Portunus trituberculatus]|uniref:Uncharacterized protein n=1 Tax=Portunus trituberculatus TaxID=210409 RepID=A0A5B7IM29_PORTR|nr:hypothetical protein [Portunus trituberculatus]
MITRPGAALDTAALALISRSQSSPVLCKRKGAGSKRIFFSKHAGSSSSSISQLRGVRANSNASKPAKSQFTFGRGSREIDEK